MRLSRWIVLISGVVLIAVAGAFYALPGLVRHVAIARIHAMTGRPVSIDAVDVRLLSGRVTVHRLRVGERGGGEPAFAGFERLDLRLQLPSLLLGRVWIRELVLHQPTVRVVRFPDEFNFSDLIRNTGATSGTFDITVDRFALAGGTVTFEDRALPEWRTWTSENIQIEARNVSTRRDDGTATGSSVTAGAPASIDVQHLRLYPIQLQAVVAVKGLDLSLARLYLPASAPFTLDRGRMSSTLKVAMDARGGIRADLTGDFEDVAVVKPGEREPAARVPKLTAQLSDLTFRDGSFRLARFEVNGSASVRDPTKTGAPFQHSTVRASIADLTWPVTTPGRLDVLTSIPGGGTLALTGTVRPPPEPSQLRLRLANLNLSPWAASLPVSAGVDGFAEADLSIDEPLAAGVPAHIQGSVAVNRLGLSDGKQKLLGAERVQATGIEVDWPKRVTVKRLLLSGPRATVERDKDGAYPLLGLLKQPAPRSTPAKAPASTVGAQPSGAAPTIPIALGAEVGEIAVRDGALAWRDKTLAPPVALDFARIDASVTGGGWPLRGPLGVRAALRPPGGGQVQVSGRVGIDPLSAELRVKATDAELAPYQSYAGTTARIGGRADLDVAVALPTLSERRAMVRGNAGLSRVDIRDGQRTVMRLERGAATGLEVDWPERIDVRHLALQRPWILLERDEKGALPIRALLPGGTTSAPASPPPAANEPAAAVESGGAGLPITVRQIVVDEGGARVVDRSISPPFAVDFQRLALNMDGFATPAGAKPARFGLTGRVGAASLVTLRGTIGPVGGPVRLDVDGEIKGFAVPRTNPYLLRYVGWEAREGWLTTNVRCRIDGDALEVKTDIRLSRLQVARASSRDEAQSRIGLPLGMITSLMKDPRGEIHISLPVGGRLSDPRFDLTEAIWSTARNVAIKAITAPVSWIGRVRLGADSRIQRIEVDPIPFEPGTATVSPEGQEQVTRVAAFLEQTPEARIALTPVVSSSDLAALKRRTLDAAVERAAREARVSPDEAAIRLFKQRFAERSVPGAPDAVRAALVESEAAPAAAASTLAAERLDAVRAMFKKAGIQAARLPEEKGADAAAAGAGQVELKLVEPDSSHQPQPGSPRPGLLRRLMSEPGAGERAARG
ncbi:MAG TPA: DUF748 domain-containing protein [Methylomirabilota bacterium]|nr:DUF748 domain-containing protein [Methylomirabilota bacterium]